MKTNKILVSILAITAILLTSSVSAMGPKDGSGNNSGTNTNFVDENENGIADGQEDDDNDGILNKDDEDYERSQDGTGNKNGNAMRNGSGAMNGSGSMNEGKKNNSSKFINKTKKSQYKNIFKNKYQSRIDSMTEDKKNILLDKIDDLEEKIENSTSYTDDKKEQYMSLLEAFKEIVSESLESEEEVDIDDLLE